MKIAFGVVTGFIWQGIASSGLLVRCATLESLHHQEDTHVSWQRTVEPRRRKDDKA